MYCKKCKYHAFDHLSSCPRCGVNWEETRKALHLAWLTSPGHNWFTPLNTDGQPENSSSVDGLEVANLPDLDFEKTTQPASTPYTPQSEPGTDQVTPDFSSQTSPSPDFIELDFGLAEPTTPNLSSSVTSPILDLKPPQSEPVNDIIELDFSLPEETSAPASPGQTAKHDALFIPKLEEMLAPLPSDPKPAPIKKEIKKDAAESDIYLNFRQSRPSTSVKPDMAEMDLLNFDVKK